MSLPASDDGWGELARELGLDEVSPISHQEQSPRPSEAIGFRENQQAVDPEAEHNDQTEWGSESLDGDAESDLEDSEGEDGDLDPESSPGSGSSDEGPGGAGRKRRRRRRRRKKGGPGDDIESVNEAVDETPEPEPTPIQTKRRFPAVAQRSDDYSDHSLNTHEMDDGEEERRVGLVEEDTAGEVLRELIATWNVPSWDEIITGLYRPER